MVRRRYQRGLHNFFRLYQPLADTWQLLNNTNPAEPRLIAEGEGTIERVADQAVWDQIRRGIES